MLSGLGGSLSFFLLAEGRGGPGGRRVPRSLQRRRRLPHGRGAAAGSEGLRGGQPFRPVPVPVCPLSLAAVFPSRLLLRSPQQQRSGRKLRRVSARLSGSPGTVPPALPQSRGAGGGERREVSRPCRAEQKPEWTPPSAL